MSIRDRRRARIERRQAEAVDTETTPEARPDAASEAPVEPVKSKPAPKRRTPKKRS